MKEKKERRNAYLRFSVAPFTWFPAPAIFLKRTNVTEESQAPLKDLLASVINTG